MSAISSSSKRLVNCGGSWLPPLAILWHHISKPIQCVLCENFYKATGSAQREALYWWVASLCSVYWIRRYKCAKTKLISSLCEERKMTVTIMVWLESLGLWGLEQNPLCHRVPDASCTGQNFSLQFGIKVNPSVFLHACLLPGSQRLLGNCLLSRGSTPVPSPIKLFISL